MLLEDELLQGAPGGPTVCTLGVFDGVHQGHCALIKATIGRAAARNAKSVVLVLHPHPRNVLSGRPMIPVITPIDERLHLIRQCGADAAIAITFTRELSDYTPQQFTQALVDNLGMVELVVGPDFALGHNRAGNAEELGRIGHDQGFDVSVLPMVEQTGHKVSSTAVRTALADGNVARVAEMLERPYITRGTVVHGEHRGRMLGYPTANIRPEDGRALPADGIYATRTNLGGRVYNSATYIGTSPTFDGHQRVIEVLLFDFDADIYGEDIAVEWVDMVRGDRKFESAEALQAQMAKDVEKAKTVLAAG